jgi:hypothetical protein
MRAKGREGQAHLNVGLLNMSVLQAVEHNPACSVSLRATIRSLNERALGLLARTAQGVDWIEGAASRKEIFAPWAEVDAATVHRAAACPMVLLDFNFQRIAWWGHRALEISFSEDSRLSMRALFTVEEALPLARDLVLEAWSSARSASRVACLLFGMAPEVATLIARLSARDIDRVVKRNLSDLTLRWESRPTFWRELLRAARRTDDEDLTSVYLHSLQLYGGELMASRGRSFRSATADHEPGRHTR